MGWRQRRAHRKLYGEAVTAWRDGLIAGARPEDFHCAPAGAARALAYRAGYELARDGARAPRELPVEVWALVVAETQRPSEVERDWR